jgi:hypothetical protein
MTEIFSFRILHLERHASGWMFSIEFKRRTKIVAHYATNRQGKGLWGNAKAPILPPLEDNPVGRVETVDAFSLPPRRQEAKAAIMLYFQSRHAEAEKKESSQPAEG